MNPHEVRALEDACPLSKGGEVSHFHCDVCGKCPGVENIHPDEEGVELPAGFYTVFITRRTSTNGCHCKNAPMMSVCAECGSKIADMFGLPREFEARFDKVLETVKTLVKTDPVGTLGPLMELVPLPARALRNEALVAKLKKELDCEQMSDFDFNKMAIDRGWVR